MWRASRSSRQQVPDQQIQQHQGGDRHHAGQQEPVGRLSPRRCVDFTVVEAAESFAFGCLVKHAVFDQFLQAELDRVLDHTVDVLAAAAVGDPNAFEVPQLVPEFTVRFAVVVDAAKVDDFAVVG